MAASAACRRGGFALLTFARGFFFSGALGFAAGVLRFAGFADGFAAGLRHLCEDHNDGRVDFHRLQKGIDRSLKRGC